MHTAANYGILPASRRSNHSIRAAIHLYSTSSQSSVPRIPSPYHGCSTFFAAE